MSAPVGRVGEFQVNGTPCSVYMNMNTLSRFDELANESLLAVASQIWAAAAKLPPIPEGASAEEIERLNGERGLALLQSINLRTLHYLGAAALHRYDRSGEPSWSYTPGKLGAVLEFTQWAELFNTLMKGLGNFMPQESDIPAHAAAEAKSQQAENPTPADYPTLPDESVGGPPSTPSDADVLDSMTRSSDEAPSGGSA